MRVFCGKFYCNPFKIRRITNLVEYDYYVLKLYDISKHMYICVCICLCVYT